LDLVTPPGRGRGGRGGEHELILDPKAKLVFVCISRTGRTTAREMEGRGRSGNPSAGPGTVQQLERESLEIRGGIRPMEKDRTSLVMWTGERERK